jgi:signal transduction histidine kinase
VLLALGYYLAAQASVALAERWIVLPVWPPVGVAVAGLVLFGWRVWPGILAGSFLTGLSQGLPADIGTTVAQTAAPLAVVAMLKSHPFRPSLTEVPDTIRLLILGPACLIPSAVVATAVRAAEGKVTDGWLHFGAIWWVGDAMGILLVVPLLLGLAQGGHTRRRGEAVAVALATAVATRLLFSGTLPLVFLVFPFTLWAALRLDQLAVAVVNAVVAGIAIWTTVEGHGPFGDLPTTTSLFVLEAFNAGVAVTSLVLAAAVATMNRLTDENERLHAEVRSQLQEVLTSRARIVQAADRERRRLERDLHDGAQQRLVSLACTLGLLQSQVAPPHGEPAKVTASLDRALEEVRLTLSELRSLAQGIHPAVLTQEGLGPALERLAEQATIPVAVETPTRRYPPVVEAAAYFVASEALTNIGKHAQATRAWITVHETGGSVVLEVSDDGVGGADPRRGSGLTGLVDRVAALQGGVRVDSQPGRGTTVQAVLPCHWSEPERAAPRLSDRSMRSGANGSAAARR